MADYNFGLTPLKQALNKMQKITIIGLCMMLVLILVNGGNKQEQSHCINENCFNLGVNSSMAFKNITATFVIDCSLPKYYGDRTVEIVYGEAIYDNTNTIEISFIEFCKRLEK